MSECKESKKGMKMKGPKELANVTALFGKNAAVKNLLLGSVSGWTSGFLVMKVGRPAAFVVGGGIILSQIAHHAGYINLDWDKLKGKAQQSSKTLTSSSPVTKARHFARGNPYFTAGFIGGFLIGVAT